MCRVGWTNTKKNIMPHINNSWRGYPGRWVCSLGKGSNLMVTELLECIDHAFSDVCK